MRDDTHHVRIESQVIAVPGRMESFEAAGDIVEIIMERVMRESCSFEERTRKRRAAALAKVKQSKRVLVALIERVISRAEPVFGAPREQSHTRRIRVLPCQKECHPVNTNMLETCDREDTLTSVAARNLTHRPCFCCTLLYSSEL